MNSKILPNFIIAGVARCGTTSLYHYLDQHPEIGFSEIKEPKYFSGKYIVFPHTGPGDATVDAKVVKTEKEYLELFKNVTTEKAVGEASSDYFFYHENTIPKIKESLGDVKIILCFRNPIERAHSAYNNLIRDSRENLSFAEALAAEHGRMEKNYDWMWYYKSGSLFADGLQAFKNNFSEVKVVFLDDMEKNPQKILAEICLFLGVDASFSFDVETKYSHSGEPKNKFISLLTNRNIKPIYYLREAIIKIFPRKLLEKIASGMFVKNEIPSDVKSELDEFFRNDIKKLEKLTGRNFSHWK